MRSGAKPFEVRWDDRDFAVGDRLFLKEFDPHTGRFSGEVEAPVVTYVLRDERFGVKPGFVVLGLGFPRAPVELTLDAPTPEQLAAGHEQLGRDARLKAANWLGSARSHAETGNQHSANAHRGMARAAGAEAVHHEQAARLIRELMAHATPDLFQSESANG